jgi:hypothetical protein
MKRIVMFAASLMLAVAAQAEEQLEIGVEMTPLATQKADQADRRFENYALETASGGGQ